MTLYDTIWHFVTIYDIVNKDVPLLLHLGGTYHGVWLSPGVDWAGSIWKATRPVGDGYGVPRKGDPATRDVENQRFGESNIWGNHSFFWCSQFCRSQLDILKIAKAQRNWWENMSTSCRLLKWRTSICYLGLAAWTVWGLSGSKLHMIPCRLK